MWGVVLHLVAVGQACIALCVLVVPLQLDNSCEYGHVLHVVSIKTVFAVFGLVLFRSGTVARGNHIGGRQPSTCGLFQTVVNR